MVCLMVLMVPHWMAADGCRCQLTDGVCTRSMSLARIAPRFVRALFRRSRALAVKVKANFGSATVRRIAPDSGYVLTPIPLLCVICTSSHRIGDILLRRKRASGQDLKPSAFGPLGLWVSHCTHAPTHPPTHLTVGTLALPLAQVQHFKYYLRSSSLGRPPARIALHRLDQTPTSPNQGILGGKRP
jgi:hypothetical protein